VTRSHDVDRASPMTPPVAPRPDLRHLVAVPAGDRRLPAIDVDGWDLWGRGRTVRLSSPGSWTLLLFLSSHCDGCEPFWGVPRVPTTCGLETHDAAIVVTRGPQHERPQALVSLMGKGLAEVPDALVMSDSAWVRYGVHGAPFFVLLDGVCVVSEGVAWSVEQVASDVGRAKGRRDGRASGARHARR
jgi:hypothetical protein